MPEVEAKLFVQLAQRGLDQRLALVHAAAGQGVLPGVPAHSRRPVGEQHRRAVILQVLHHHDRDGGQPQVRFVDRPALERGQLRRYVVAQRLPEREGGLAHEVGPDWFRRRSLHQNGAGCQPAQDEPRPRSAYSGASMDMMMVERNSPFQR